MVEPVYHEPVYIEPKPIVEVVPEPVPIVEPKSKPIPVVEPKPVKVESKPKPVPVVAPKSISPSGFYAGLGITGSRYKSACNCPKVSGVEGSVGVVARLGYDFNRYIGIEARGMKSLTSSKADISHTGLFIKPMAPVSDKLNLYGLVGFAKTKVTGQYQNVDAESLALGGGVEVDLSKDTPKEGRYSRNFDGQGDQEKGMGLFVDYERLVAKKDAPDLDTMSVGVTYDF
ncbi:hypothetical protein MNB_SV-3-1489 [hydrothermal vent metagenome]|uniref:Outer membrane protein beta-barrel domain-containing protein n=1 Tax=hydrothermal vent metagenome TaxID=652676 RepID=A0A1W1CY50_9ZZZZ